MDSWSEMFDAERWWSALNDAGIDVDATIHGGYELSDRLPWDHVNVKKGREFLEKEQGRAVTQLEAMADAR